MTSIHCFRPVKREVAFGCPNYCPNYQGASSASHKEASPPIIHSHLITSIFYTRIKHDESCFLRTVHTEDRRSSLLLGAGDCPPMFHRIYVVNGGHTSQVSSFDESLHEIQKPKGKVRSKRNYNTDVE